MGKFTSACCLKIANIIIEKCFNSNNICFVGCHCSDVTYLLTYAMHSQPLSVF
jgi:hypothetical protein